MQSEKFDLVFSGQVLPRQEVSVVKANMAALFKASSAQIDALFSGKTVVLKRNLDLAAANRYRVAIKKAGARVDLVKAGAAQTAAAKAPAPQAQPASHDTATARAKAPERAPAALSESPAAASPAAGNLQAAAQFELAEVGAHLSDGVASDVPLVDAPDFEVFNPGSDLLTEAEKNTFVAKEVDTSSLSLRDNDGNLLDEGEWQSELPVIVADLDADILPAGADLLTDGERKPLEKASVADLDLDVAPAGERLQPERVQSAQAPNVDHIRLAD
ncbi:MAG TPA: hypothetical protein VIC26_06735 [Marinagarivorans sp.]